MALLCFSVAGYPRNSKQCHWFDGSEYGMLEEITYNDYVYTSPTLPSYKGLPFIVGGIIGQYAGRDYRFSEWLLLFQMQWQPSCIWSPSIFDLTVFMCLFGNIQDRNNPHKNCIPIMLKSVAMISTAGIQWLHIHLLRRYFNIQRLRLAILSFSLVVLFMMTHFLQGLVHNTRERDFVTH